MSRIISILTLVFTIATTSNAGVELYVSPRGNDAGAGTAEEPFLTLARAREAIGKLVAGGLTTDVRVVIHGGTYCLNQPLVFGPKFSGTEQHSITFAAFPGETPVISGGRQVTGWAKGTCQVWTVFLPDVKLGKWCFRQLFVNGHPAVRARSPNFNDDPPYYSVSGAQLSEDNQYFQVALKTGRVHAWQNLSDVELVACGEFEILRKQIWRVNEAAATVYLNPPHVRGHPMMMPREKTRCYLENALEFLDQPGEWYADRRTGVLYYWPLPGEDMISAKVFAPILTSILELKGTPGFSVKNMHFKGLHFAHVNWPLPKGGYSGLQACFYSIANFQRPWFDLVAQVPPAINWQFAKSCSFEDGQISQVGGVGLQVGRGCSSNLIEGNIFCDIGGNGLMIGEGKDSAHFAEAVTANRVLDNHVYRCGTEYFGAVGIWAGYASETIIAHNAVHDLPYSAISVGWRWDASPTGCRSNIIEYNDVHHFMGTLSDGAGIYTLGFQPGTIIRGNLVHDYAYHGQGVYGANSLQLDDGSKGLYIDSNITCDGAGRVHLNLVPGLATTPAEWNTWGTNYFEVNSSDTNFPKELAGKAGLEPEYRKRLIETR